MKMLHKSINGHRIKAMVVFEMEIIDTALPFHMIVVGSSNVNDILMFIGHHLLRS